VICSCSSSTQNPAHGIATLRRIPRYLSEVLPGILNVRVVWYDISEKVRQLWSAYISHLGFTTVVSLMFSTSLSGLMVWMIRIRSVAASDLWEHLQELPVIWCCHFFNLWDIPFGLTSLSGGGITHLQCAIRAVLASIHNILRVFNGRIVMYRQSRPYCSMKYGDLRLMPKKRPPKRFCCGAPNQNYTWEDDAVEQIIQHDGSSPRAGVQDVPGKCPQLFLCICFCACGTW
jgi:hypothetical protein